MERSYESKATIFERKGIKVNNGEAVSFWLDPCLDEILLCQKYSMLFELTMNQNCSVKEVEEKGWVIQFKIRL
jgi:hypothetical protein